MPTAPPGGRILTGDFLRVTVGNFCFFLTFASFFLLPLHIRALGGSERMVGFLMGTTGVSGLVSVLVVGPLLDRFGRRVFLRFGMLGMGLAAAAWLWPTEIGPAMFVLRVVQGLAFAAGFNAAATLAAELAPLARRTSALGLFGVSTLATHALAPALGEQLVRAGGFALLFAVASLFCFVGLAVTWSLPAGSRRRHGVSPASLHGIAGLAGTIGAVACCGVAFGSVLTFMPTFVQEQGWGAVAAFYMAYTSTAVLVRVVGGSLGDRVGHRPVILPAMALLGLSIGAIAAVRSLAELVVAGLVFGAAQGFVYPTLNAWTVGLVAEDQLGRTQSLYNGAFNLGTTLGSMALGNVVHGFGHRAMFVCAGAMVVVALGLFEAGSGGARAGPAAR